MRGAPKPLVVMPVFGGPSVLGEIDKGETAEQAAVREVCEELGVAANQLQPHYLHKGKHLTPEGTAHTFSFLWAHLAKDRTKDFQLAPREVAATKWVTLAEMRRLYTQAPDQLIIASDTSDTKVWSDIFVYLEAIITSIMSKQQKILYRV